MITLDWKERLKLDTEDFVERKLPEGDYYIDIVYNAYPKRVDNKIPSEVINFVSKILTSKIAKTAKDYIPFYDYLWNDKGDYGRQIFIYIMRTVVKRDPEFFLDYLHKNIKKDPGSAEVKALLRRAVAPLMTSEGKKYIDTVFNWIGIDDVELHKSIINLMVKACKDDPTLIKNIFQKVERGWIYPTDHTLRDSSTFLKAISKIDQEFYISVYDNYKNSRNPVFIEILSSSLMAIEDPKAIERLLGYFENWSQSGNIRVKKAGQVGVRYLRKRIKK
ncbi:MAG: hypothetical protein WCX83_05615 [Candidatus Cloacimonas sp.]|nr:hypothetical protein [Candidatus Cloacimonadota bacterium]